MEKYSGSGFENASLGEKYKSLGLDKYVIELRGELRARLRAGGRSEEEIDTLTATPDENRNNPLMILSLVTMEDVNSLIRVFEENKIKQLEEFNEKGEGFNPETGNLVNNDTSWWDERISELKAIQEKVENL